MKDLPALCSYLVPAGYSGGPRDASTAGALTNPRWAEHVASRKSCTSWLGCGGGRIASSAASRPGEELPAHLCGCVISVRAVALNAPV
jgi:hypothetical protein